MYRKFRRIFWVDEAQVAPSDIAVLILLTASLILGGYAIHVMGGF